MKKLKINLKIVAGIATILAIWMAVYTVRFVYADLIYTNTFIGQTNIGGMTTSEAVDIVEAELTDFMSRSVVIINGDQTFEFTPEELGITYDYEKIKESLPALWDGRGVINGIYQLLSMKQVTLVVEIDEASLADTISILYTEEPPQNAYLYLDKELDEITITKEKNGQTLDLKTLASSLEKKFESLDTDAVGLPLETLYPSVTTSDIEPFVDVAKAVFANAVAIYYGDNEWEFDPNEYANLITFGTKDTLEIAGINGPVAVVWGEEEDPSTIKNSSSITSSLKITLDEGALSSYMDGQIKEQIEVPAENVVITLDEEGNILFEGSAADGISINKEAFVTELELALENDISEIEVPTMTIKGGVDVPEELQNLGITELIATGYTNYDGSPYNRQMNIAVGMSKFNGLIVEPGEVFSFLDALGVVDASTGYYKELVITNNETVPEYGGGLCQVSSTLFRAMLYGGLPITTRYEHSYAVSYYAYPSGYGLDATIYQPWPDLQFTNDTGSAILIQAYVDGNNAYFKFYGTSDGRTVTMDGPYYSNYVSPPAAIITYTTELEAGTRIQKDHSHTGFDADWYRTIVFPDGTTEQENIHSHYQAWPAKYLVGISEEEYSATEEGEGG